MDTCSPSFERMAATVGLRCDDVRTVVHLRDPADLSNATLPALEALMVLGAALALVLAIRRHRQGDPTTLVLWLGAVLYLLILEPVLYFPDAFGIPAPDGIYFLHNVFTVEFFYDRLPLYIVALYPALATLAYEIVRALGLFRTRGPLVGALAVGLVHHWLYEVFDQLGPQRQWWVWNSEHPNNHPFLASVPLTSVVLFSAVAPASLAYVVNRAVLPRVSEGRGVSGRRVIGVTLLLGVAGILGQTLASLPTTILTGGGTDSTVQGVVLITEIVLFWTIGGAALLRAVRAGVRGEPGWFVRWYGALYLGVFAILWASSLPAWFAGEDGRTEAGTPTGNLAFAAVCFGCATLVVVVAGRRHARRPAPQRKGGPPIATLTD